MWNLKKYKNNIAMITDDGITYTYHQLDQLQQEFAAKVQHRKLGFIICTNAVACVVAYVSCITNKIPIMLVSENIIDEKLEELIDKYKPEWIYKPQGNGTYELVRKDVNEEYVIHNELALLMSTSGSTGSSKQVRISYKNLKFNTESIVEALGVSESDRAITSLPLNYCYGLSVINTHLYVGATVLITNDKVISTRFWKFASIQNATTFAGVPYTYEILRKLKIFEREAVRFSKLLHSGEKLSEEMERFLRAYVTAKGAKLYLMYGQTEATARMACVCSAESSKSGTVGQAIAGGKFEIIDEVGKYVNVGDVGEIVYRGGNVSMGYARDYSGLWQGDVNNGVLKTGDMGYMDEDGDLYVVGRRDRMVKINGLRTNLNYLEECLKEKFGNIYRVSYEEEILWVRAGELIGGEDEYVARLVGVNKRVVKCKVVVTYYK